MGLFKKACVDYSVSISIANKNGNEENILVGETRSTLVQAVFDFPRESKCGAIKYAERERGGEGENGESNDWPKEANNPRGISLFTSREMPLELKSRIRYFF